MAKKPKPWSDRITALEEKAGGLERLALKIGVSYFTVLRWKKGMHEPRQMARRAIEKLERR